MPRLALPQPACDRVLFRWRPWIETGSSRRATARSVGATASASLSPPAASFNPNRPRSRLAFVAPTCLPVGSRCRWFSPSLCLSLRSLFLCGGCLYFSQIFLRLPSVLSVSNLLTSRPSETPANSPSRTFVLGRNGPRGLSTPPLSSGILSRVRGSPKRLECLHLHHPNAHERPAPPPAAPPFLPQNSDPKSYTPIALMASINASFLTSSPRSSIDSRIGVV